MQHDAVGRECELFERGLLLRRRVYEEGKSLVGVTCQDRGVEVSRAIRRSHSHPIVGALDFRHDLSGRPSP